MIQVRTLEEIARLRAQVERIGRLSDSLFRIGPVGIGLDGLLAWIPFIPVGAIYSGLAGVFLLAQACRAGAPRIVLAQAALLLTARTAVTAAGEAALPLLASELAVDLFRAHRWSADLIVRAIDQTHYVEGPKDPSNPRFPTAEAARLRAGKRRLVFLG